MEKKLDYQSISALQDKVPDVVEDEYRESCRKTLPLVVAELERTL